MIYKIFADVTAILHFFWILFMIIGFVATFCSVFFSKNKQFLDRWVFRTIHFCGIVYVGLLAILRKYCPLTVLENTLRAKYNPELEHFDSFITHYLQKLVYLDIEPLIVLIPTIFIAIFTIVVYILKPPAKIKKFY